MLAPMERKSLDKRAQNTAWRTVWDLWVTELFRKRGLFSGILALWRQTGAPPEFDLEPGRVGIIYCPD